jgi:23S rRNA maturation-related 3'-5' exoribonuclease YhaM
MYLYDNISNKTLGKKFRVGVVLKNKDNKILLFKNKIKRINKELYDIPCVEIDEFKEENIIYMLKNKYNINIQKIYGYINEYNVLDENCNNNLQVNVCSDIYMDKELMLENYLYRDVDYVLEKCIISDYLRECLEIYKYNFNNNK